MLAAIGQPHSSFLQIEQAFCAGNPGIPVEKSQTQLSAGVAPNVQSRA
jgi:hypothetical protein